MLGNINEPERIMSNQSSHHENSCKKIKNNQEWVVQAQQRPLSNILTSEKDQNTESRTCQHEIKPQFKQKIKKKKETFKKSLSSIERGPKRIMRKYLNKYRRSSHEKHEQENQEESQQFDSNEQENEQNYTISGRLKQKELHEDSVDYLANTHNKLFKKRTLRFHANAQLIFPIAEGFKYHYSVNRRHDGVKYFTPQFQLIDQENEITIYCKKMSLFQFAFTLKHGEWTSEHQSYIGKLVSNITGSVLNFHLKFFCKQRIEQRIVCSIQFTNSYFAFKKPRKIQVFMLNLTKINIQDRKYQNVSSLRQIYEKDLGNSNIYYLQNKYPIYNKIDKLYSLDFHGRAPVCSVKNFILQSPAHRGRQYLLFGKKGDNIYNLDFMHPFSLVTAFAVSISNFNGKLICQ